MESDEVRQKPIPKTEITINASQKCMKTIFLILKSQNVCILATVKPAEKAGICKVYYEEKALLEWQVMFTVVKNLDALQQVIILLYDLHV